MITYTDEMYVGFYCWSIFWASHLFLGLCLTLFSDRKTAGPPNEFEVALTVFKNMIWTGICSIFIFYCPTLLAIQNSFFQLTLTLLLTECWFYHIHRLLHSSWCYALWHKQHHAFNQPYALAALYCSPVEAVICNMLAISIGPMILGVRGYYLYLWFFLVALNATVTHSGFRLKIGSLVIIDNTHDIHHSKFNTNYGTITLFDRLYSTYYRS